MEVGDRIRMLKWPVCSVPPPFVPCPPEAEVVWKRVVQPGGGGHWAGRTEAACCRMQTSGLGSGDLCME